MEAATAIVGAIALFAVLCLPAWVVSRVLVSFAEKLLEFLTGDDPSIVSWLVGALGGSNALERLWGYLKVFPDRPGLSIQLVLFAFRDAIVWVGTAILALIWTAKILD
jgi:hypothetical protein